MPEVCPDKIVFGRFGVIASHKRRLQSGPPVVGREENSALNYESWRPTLSFGTLHETKIKEIFLSLLIKWKENFQGAKKVKEERNGIKLSINSSSSDWWWSSERKVSFGSRDFHSANTTMSKFSSWKDFKEMPPSSHVLTCCQKFRTFIKGEATCSLVREEWEETRRKRRRRKFWSELQIPSLKFHRVRLRYSLWRRFEMLERWDYQLWHLVDKSLSWCCFPRRRWSCSCCQRRKLVSPCRNGF